MLGTTAILLTCLYIALPYALAPAVARCHESASAEWILANLYRPLLGADANNFYRTAWYKRLNRLIDERVTLATCPDLDSRID